MNVRGRLLVDMKGFDSTIGYTQWANKPAERDAAIRFPLPSLSLPISPPVPPSDTRHRPPNNSSSRHCVRPAPSSLCQDERTADPTCLRELESAVGPYVQPVVGLTHRRWLVRWRGCAACHGRFHDRRWLGRRREHTHSVRLLRHLWFEAGPGRVSYAGSVGASF